MELEKKVCVPFCMFCELFLFILYYKGVSYLAPGNNCRQRGEDENYYSTLKSDKEAKIETSEAELGAAQPKMG